MTKLLHTTANTAYANINQEFHGTDIPHANGIASHSLERIFNHGIDGSHSSVFDVDFQSGGCVVRSRPIVLFRRLMVYHLINHEIDKMEADSILI